MKKLMELEELIEKQKSKINKIKRKEQLTKKNINVNNRKQRVHELIKLGALFEIAELKDTNKALLLGWIMKLPYLTKDEMKNIQKDGQQILDNRKNKDNKD